MEQTTLTRIVHFLHRLFPARVPQQGNGSETTAPGFMSRAADSVAWKRNNSGWKPVSALTMFPFFAMIIGFALAIISGGTAKAQLTFTFSENGMGNTTVTGSGSTTLTAATSAADNNGFILGAPGSPWNTILSGSSNLGPLPTSYLPSTSANPFGGVITGNLTLSDSIVRFDSAFVDTTGTNQNISFYRPVDIPVGVPLTLSGSFDYNLPFSYFTTAGLLGTTGTGFTGGFIFVFGPQPSGAASGVTSQPGHAAPQPFIAVNGGAILSAETNGLSSMSTSLSNVQNAAQNAVGDLNNRIFNARSGGTQGGNGNGVASTLDGTSRYLNFAQNQGIDYRVALGLAEGKEVEMVDTLSPAGNPFAMAGIPAMTKTVVVAVEGGKSPVGEKVVIEETPQTTYEVFTSFDYGYYDQDNLTRTYRGFESDTYAGSAVLEVCLTDWLVAGAAFTYLESNTTSTANLGSNGLEGNLLSGYLTAFHGNTYLDVLYSYGDFDNDISRNTLLGRTAYGDTESHSHNIDLNLGHTIHVTENFSFGPSAGANYTTGEVDGYTERNGGLANLIYPDHDFESMIGRLGGFATYRCETPAGMLTNQLSAGWAHEFMPDGGNVTASLETSPFALVTGNNIQSIGGFTAQQERAHAGTDWLELGVTSRLDIKKTGFNVQLGYQGMFGRNNASGHFGSAKIGYEW